jgi:hypothetical protein
MSYDEDRFNPTNVNDTDDIAKDASINIKGCNTISVTTDKDKKRNVTVFASGGVGNTIKNAVSGDRYNGFIVGSKYEDMFFKTILHKNGEPLTLFFETPEAYERHMHHNLKDETKRQGYLKKTEFERKEKIKIVKLIL